MKNFYRKIFIGFLLLLTSSLFYLPLFYPQLKLIFTPDLGRSDSVHYFFVKMFIYADKLKSGEVPLWNSKIGTGVSLIGEGQIGSYNLINFFLYRFFPLEYAFNLVYVSNGFLVLLGTYLFLRSLSFARSLSVFGACVFAFSGFFLFHLTHTVVFSSAVYLPWALFFVVRLLRRRVTLIDFVLLAFIFSQQLVAGHPQIFLITSVGVVLVVAGFMIVGRERIKIMKRAGVISLPLFFGLLLSAVYLFPLMEMRDISVRSEGMEYTQSTYNSLSLYDLVNIVYPFVLGDPSRGTYPLVSQNGEFDIFWEKSTYIGLLPFLLIFFLLIKRKKLKEEWVFILAVGISLLLALGKNGPLFWLFFLPPFSFFQVPARFLLLAAFFLAVLATYGLANWRGRFRIFIAIILVILPAFYFTYTYHLLTPVQKITAKPEVLSLVNPEKGRVLQIGSSAPYIDLLLKEGWKESKYYEFSLNSVSADANVLYDVSQVEVYDSLLTRRQDVMQKLLKGTISGNLASYEATPTAAFKQLLNITNSVYLISPFRIADADLMQVGKVESIPYQPFYIYENRGVLPRVRLVGSYVNAGGFPQAVQEVSTGKADLTEAVVIEEEIGETVEMPQDYKVKIEKETDTYLSIKVISDKQALLVLADSFYPGWKARVNGRVTKIYAANINQRAVVVPKGESMVEFEYQPASFSWGLKISVISYIVLIILLAYEFTLGRVKRHG